MSPLAKRVLKWSMVAVVCCLVSYVVSYSMLSAAGGWVVSESGKRRPLVGLAMSDILIWQPRYGYCQWFHSVDGSEGLRAWGFLGYFYAPLILFDQAYVHRTIYYIRPDGSMAESFPAYEEYHPVRVNRFHGRFPYEEESKK